MSLTVGCPRCAAPVVPGPAGWVCLEHGETDPLWRPDDVTYETFAEHLLATPGFPTYLPWPLGPGWAVSDFAVVGPPERPRATMTCCSGTSALDGPVDVMVVAEEAGTGFGARVAGTARDDPGAEVAQGPPTVRVRVGAQVVPLWPVSVADGTDTTHDLPDGSEWDRSVLVGEAFGRWLWLVLRPASAVLLLRDGWILRDVSLEGPHLVELPFGGPTPGW